MILNNIWVETEDYLDQVEPDDIILYLYNKKKISAQAVKKYFNIETIGEKPSMTWQIWLDPEKIGIDEDTLFDAANDDDLYDHLKDNNYQFPGMVEEDSDAERVETIVADDYFSMIRDVKELFNQYFGKTYTKEDLKQQISEAIDWFGMDADK